jgi:excinuclease ABC subunit C
METSTLKRKVADLPQNPGVYFFLGEAQSASGGRAKNRPILYIGKATNLRSRVQSYFRGENVAGRSEWISLMIGQVEDIDFEQTDSVLEALILESNLIKKHQPKYNTLEKDDKSFSYFVITKEEFPKVLIVRKTDIEKISNLKSQISNKSKIKNKNDNSKLKNSKLIQNSKLEIKNSNVFGPYTSKYQMQTALKIIRRIFPFHALKQKTEKGCLDFQIGMCPGPYADAISKIDYAKNILGIKMILEGKKKRLVSTLEKEMQAFAKKDEFEKAAVLRNKIFALQHIRDVALMTRDFEDKELGIRNSELGTMRIEAYDISNISGQNAVGSMVVFENRAPNKAQYRKFKIKTVEGSNDVAMMKEVLSRRFNNDWAMPDLVLLDGGQGHVNTIGELVRELGLDVLIVGVAKGVTRKNLNFQFPISNKIPMSQFPKELQDFLNDKNLVKSIMDEAHRFAIGYHRKLRSKNALK